MEKVFRKFHAGIAAGSKDIPILIMHSFFYLGVYITDAARMWSFWNPELQIFNAMSNLDTI